MACAYHILRRVIGIQAQADTEGGCVKAHGIELIHQFQSLLAGLQGAYLLQIRQDGLIAQFVAAHAVHIEAIERTYLLSVATLWQIFLIGILHNQCVDTLFVQLLQINERTVLGVLLVQWVVLQPRANGILPEVVTRFYTRVHVRSKVLCHTCHHAHDGEEYGNHQSFHFINRFSECK